MVAMSFLRPGHVLLYNVSPLRSVPWRLLATRAHAGPRGIGGSSGRGRADDGPRLNTALRNLREVRLISKEGTDEGLMSGSTAYSRARDAGLDLMQVRGAGQNGAAVVRLVDYGAYLEIQRRRCYEAARRKKSSDSRSGSNRLKQVRLSPSIGPHDLAIKLRQARGFLMDGHRVRVYMQFRRGQGRLKDDAKATLAGVAHELSTMGRLCGVASVNDVEQLFKEPPPDPNAPPDAPRPQKTLEILFDPLPKRLREKALKEEAQLESNQQYRKSASESLK